MSPRTVFLASILTVILINFNTVAAQDMNSEFTDSQERLRARIEASGIPPNLKVGNEYIYAAVALPLFYERRGYELAWSDGSILSSNLDSLIYEIERADYNGLISNDYHLKQIKRMYAEIKRDLAKRKLLNAGCLIDLDLLLTDAFLIYGSHLLSGRVDPFTIDSEWFTDLRQKDMAELLEKALSNNQVVLSLEDLLPPQKGYKKLREFLAKYRSMEQSGGFELISAEGKLRLYDIDPRIVELRNHLILTGDLNSSESDTSRLFDKELDSAVRNFQRRHGLDDDGVVGNQTLAAINMPIQDRINLIKLNLERWRWLPQNMGSRHIIVNIANYDLDVIENETTKISMRAVVGRTYRRTPVFSDNMTYLVLNPYWNVPNSIAVQDFLPQIQKDPTYLVSQGFKVMKGWGVDMSMIDPAGIDWNALSINNFPYWLRQEPGPMNALGKVKFMFPNKFNIYLHDTPAKGLFAKSKRDFSSGCIRIEKPMELAVYVLGTDSKWSEENIHKALTTGAEQTVRLPEAIPVHILYWTAWVDDQDQINFRHDIYGRDKALLDALTEAPPNNE